MNASRSNAWQIHVRAPKRSPCKPESSSTASRGDTNAALADRLGVGEAIGGRLRRRFIEYRLDGHFDDSRPGAPRTITNDQVESVLDKTVEEKPKEAGRWSTRPMAKEVA